MNIVVKTKSGAIVTRPDTSWERDNEDLYLPDFVTKMSYTPVLFAKISKPGRSVSRKFASRYYDAVNYGILLYPEDLLDGSEEGYAAASCLDHSSFLPSPFSNPDDIAAPFHFSKNGEEIYSHFGAQRDIIESAIEEVTGKIYIRSGDIVAIELQNREEVFDRKDGNACFTGDFAGNSLLDFKIIVE